MKIVFLHPDLGLGGGERLIVNAALILKKRGHEVSILTSYFDPHRCFEELKPDGYLGSGTVNVLGSYIPRTIFGRFQVLCSVLRMVLIAFYVVVMSFLQEGYCDIIICDQISHMIPILNFSSTPILFYCHYPDLLLCTKRDTSLRKFYRFLFDYIEEKTTLMADAVVVNSVFTKNVFFDTFKSSINNSRLTPVNVKVLYPATDVKQFDVPITTIELNLALEKFPEGLKTLIRKHVLIEDDHVSLFDSEDKFVILSLNRFERKKNLELCIEAVHHLVQLTSDEKQLDSAVKKVLPSITLILAGGYDERLKESIEYFDELNHLVDTYNLSFFINVWFIKSITETQKRILFKFCDCVVYTPANEHFGIVPVEAMFNSKPVLAINSGGPLETVKHNQTGFLLPNSSEVFASHLQKLVLDKDICYKMGQAGHEYALKNFSIDSFGERLEEVCVDLVKKNNRTNHMYLALVLMLGIVFAVVYYIVTEIVYW